MCSPRSCSAPSPCNLPGRLCPGPSPGPIRQSGPASKVSLRSAASFPPGGHDYQRHLRPWHPPCRCIHEYQLTPHSLYAAVSIGLETDTIVAVLNRLSKNVLPPEIRRFVRGCTQNYGKAGPAACACPAACPSRVVPSRARRCCNVRLCLQPAHPPNPAQAPHSRRSSWCSSRTASSSSRPTPRSCASC